MRKIVLALTFGSSLLTFAQLEKNTVFVGGLIQPRFGNFSHPFSFSNVYNKITPSAGIMLSNRWALGAEFNYQTYGPKSNRYYESLYAGAFARYYFINKKNFALYENFAIGYKHSEYNFSALKQKYDFVPFKIGVGASFFVRKNLSFDMQTNLILNNLAYGNYLDAKIGLHYYIRPKK